MMAGHLYLPNNFNENKKYPAIVVVHPGGGVKEQTAGLYASKLVEAGFIMLAFDASHQGESGGQPRFLEDPTERVEDIRCAIDYFCTLNFVDSNNLGILGICAGGGYAVNASLVEKRCKAVATVSGVDIGRLFRESLGNADGVNGFLAQISQQRTAEINGAEPLLVGYVPNSPEEFTENTPEYAKEAYEYYRTDRCMHPNAPNKVLFTSFANVLGFSAFTQVSTLLTQPILLVAGSKADTRPHSEDVFKAATTEKDLYYVEGATHVDLYDKENYVNEAVEQLTKFFNKHLK